MRIGIDLSVLSREPRTGIGNYAFNLVSALLALKTEHEWVLFVSDPNDPNNSEHSDVFVNSDRCKVVELPRKKIPVYDAHVRNAKIMRRQKLDVLHGMANVLPLTLTLSRKGRGMKTVITLHDLAIYLHPKWFPGGQWLATKIIVPQSIKKADKIIVPSQTTKRDLMELFRMPEQKIAVIEHGVEERFFKRDPNTRMHANVSNVNSGHSGGDSGHSSRYILFVGTLEPRKNLGRVIEAYMGLPGGMRGEYELWVAGSKMIRHSDPERSASGVEGEESRRSFGAPQNDRIKFLNYVPDEDLPSLYQNASLFVYPSLYEGFGLPVLEAMAAGVPVITSKGSAMEEIFYNAPQPPLSLRGGEGELSAEFVDPYSVEEIRQAMVRVLSRDSAKISAISEAGYLSPAEYGRPLPSQGKSNTVANAHLARRFSWERTARMTLALYEEVMKQ